MSSREGSLGINVMAKVLCRYQKFIQKHRLVLRLAEDGLSKLVLYAPSRFVSHFEEDILDHNGKRKILPETLYALIHLWSLLNDTLYHGFGNGNGFTVGELNEHGADGTQTLSRNNEANAQKYTKSAYAIATLRSILSVVECLSPSLEVSAYYSKISDDEPLDHRTTRISGYSRSRRHRNALSMSAKVETLKFWCRLGLVALHHGQCIKNIQSWFVGHNDKFMDIVSCMGILQNGGALEPNEDVTMTKYEMDRVKRLVYVGRRTGKQYGLMNRPRERDSTKVSLLTDYQDRMTKIWQRFPIPPRGKVVMILLGELLHIYRPLFFVKSMLKNEEHDLSSRQKNMLYTWVRSLLMDIVSQILIRRGKTIQRNSYNIDISPESTKNELYHRKMKWTLYLLRAPVWDLLTHPLLTKVGNVMDYIPLVGTPLMRYIMDLVTYWERWHFMLE